MVMSKYVEHKISMNKIKYHSFEQYPLFKFSGYEVIEKDGKEYLTLTSNTPEFIQTSEKLTSHDVLCDIYNLGKSLEECNDTTKYNDIIVNWCKKHYHPCFINQLYNDIEFDGENFSVHEAFLNSKYNYISIDEFIDKVGKVYRATDTYFCLIAISQGLDDEIYNISKKRGLFPPIEIIENLKIPNRVERIKPSVTKGQLQEFLSKSEVYQDFNREEIYEWVNVDEWGNVIENLEETLQSYKSQKLFIKPTDEELDNLFYEFTNSLPKFTLQLKYDSECQRAKFVPLVNDIFDIGYFAISEKMTTEVEYQNETKKIHFNQYYAKCIYCGNLFKKKGKNHKVCLKDECRKANMNERKRRSRAKQKANENTTNPNQD